jgi:hypothetical protein
VLGANFMNDKNIIFDSEKSRLGFAPSKCDYNDFTDPKVDPFEEFHFPTAMPTKIPLNDTEKCALSVIPVSHCRAVCTGDGTETKENYISKHTQSYRNGCTLAIEEKTCTEFCNKNDMAARGPDITCLNTPWSDCNSHCKQTRSIGEWKSVTKKGVTSHVCNYVTETRECHVDQCPSDSRDFLVLADIRFYFAPGAPPNFWSNIYEEDMAKAIATVFEVSIFLYL